MMNGVESGCFPKQSTTIKLLLLGHLVDQKNNNKVGFPVDPEINAMFLLV